ncbi:DNA recombination mediator, RecA family ATPase Rad57/Rhp57 [Schizosaccharomyces osmophilus]|uniref:DNA recombination mediator, RecA family ATPase Rad57/Rhp57 n=1 Tax=Schizosaccharomyces osmophilus TaxID=2545709 RepID=A0AAF0AXH4_9SCHI|nr:DNA recombination mediator, RecA family ATPase Rad57/Rhp57 [Schizosaccharomyces osmophilus]WBW74105.1 DNA recombination mediator, RecA family ATPase Rad57/Rhp57 [Schizosaccharomyces osmophilus]
MDISNYVANFHFDEKHAAAFDNADVNTIDLLTIDVSDLEKRTNCKKDELIQIIQQVSLLLRPKRKVASQIVQSFLTTGDPVLDQKLRGGIPVGQLTEICGESGSGKSQLCMQLCIMVQLPRAFGGLNKAAVFISTESGLETKRLFELAKYLPDRFPEAEESDVFIRNPGDRVYTILCPDLESQEHIIQYQLPILFERDSIGLVVLDSVAANYRAELRYNRSKSHYTDLNNIATRGNQLGKLASILRDLSRRYEAAVVIANQVSDRLTRDYDAIGLFSLDYQSQWFNGWDDLDPNPKIPSLGLVWTNNVNTRLALIKRADSATVKARRTLRVVYSPNAARIDIPVLIGSMGIFVPKEEKDASNPLL